MGTWGLGPFENDVAADVVADIEDDADSVVRMFEEVRDEIESEGGFVDAQGGAVAVALGALVTGVALEDDQKWLLSKVRGELNRDQVAHLRNLIFRVMHGPASELVELYEEVGQVEEWRTRVQPILDAWPKV